jgi:sigma-B regulation protein RsbU (phosphoserine phosphatase)
VKPSAPFVADPAVSPLAALVRERSLVATLFDLGREVTSVLDLEQLLERLPKLISRIIEFEALAVYLLDHKRSDLTVAYSVGYPEPFAQSGRLRLGEGIVGTAVAEERSLLVNDVQADERYVEAVPGARSELVVPLRRKGNVLGAVNLLGHRTGQFTTLDVSILEQFAAHVAVAIENARLFESEREHSTTLETMAEIGREVTSILDLDVLLRRIAQLARRLLDYRTFGIMLLDEATGELEMKVGIRYGDAVTLPRLRLGDGLVGYAALHKVPVLVPDVFADARYIKVVEETRSELVIPLVHKDRCVGVFDLESPELDAFTKRHLEILTPLAAQAAVAIENARLYEEVRANELRRDRELRFAQRVQAAFLPTTLPRKLKGVDLAVRFAPARELGGDLYDFLSPEPQHLVVAVGDVSGKGLPAALYGAFAGELVRSRTFRRRYQPDRATPASVLAAMNTILHERQLEEYYCTLCYASFDFKRRVVTMANSGLPYPIRCSDGHCAPIDVTGVPLGTFAGLKYEEIVLDLAPGDLFVFCTDGVSEAMDDGGGEFGRDRVLEIVRGAYGRDAVHVADAIVSAVGDFRGPAPQNDDMTVVVIRTTL